uniref:Uncharacterized protein n=1 Tax=Anguilla anguilla TaxID=7936 RepID=A0A0E9P922_ANGAN
MLQPQVPYIITLHYFAIMKGFTRPETSHHCKIRTIITF